MFEQRVLAATGRHHGLTVASRDTAEYLLAGASVFNPWKDKIPAWCRCGPSDVTHANVANPRGYDVADNA
jgi:hypothetical protein